MSSVSQPESPGRILVVEDDPEAAAYVLHVLRHRGGFEVTHLADPAAALDRARAERWDLVLTDVEMPGMTGIELLEAVREISPQLPVAVYTAHASVDYAVRALRNKADEFLEKPVRPDKLIETVSALVEKGRAAREAARQSVLAIGAHPDDVEIGAAGTLAMHRRLGHEVSILTLSRGARGGLEDTRAGESRKAAEVLGATLYHEDLQDTSIREGDPTIGVISRIIKTVRPTVIYTHSLHDVHQDHRNTHLAALVAVRQVGRVYCFQSPSATVDFRPTRFVNIDEQAGPQAPGHRRVRLPGGDPGVPGARPHRGDRALLVPLLRGALRRAVRGDPGGGGAPGSTSSPRPRASSAARTGPGPPRRTGAAGPGPMIKYRTWPQSQHRSTPRNSPGRCQMPRDDISQQQIRVLVTGAGGPAAVSVIKSLGLDPTVQLLAADMDPWAAGLYLVPPDARTLIPAGLDPGFASAVLARCAALGVHVLIPTVDAEMRPLARARAEFAAAGIELMLAPARALDLTLDKLALARCCAGQVRVPRTELLGTVEATSGWDFPVIVKAAARGRLAGRADRGTARPSWPRGARRGGPDRPGDAPGRRVLGRRAGQASTAP